MQEPDSSRSLRMRIRHFCASLRRSSQGATALEYALLGALIAVSVMGTLRVVGAQLNGVFALYMSRIGPPPA